MAISLQTNITAMMARRNLNNANEALKTNIERLSTGKRINSAADDAAGLAVSEGMQADIRSLEEARKNTNDAVSMLETAEGAMGQAHDMLNRMKELAVQANTDAINDTQRKNIDEEFQELTNELSQLAQETNFNEQNLLNGNFAASMQVGAEASDKLVMSISQSFGASQGFGFSTIGVSTKAQAASAAAMVSSAITQVSTERAEVGSKMNRLEYKMDSISTNIQSLEAANSRIRDVDVAKETAELTQNQILTQAGTSMLSQANSTPQTALSLLGGGG